VDIRIVKVRRIDRKVRRSIAEGNSADNGRATVIHRPENRQSCVFHSIHRFPDVFPQPRIRESTCGFGKQERMFAPSMLWIRG